MEDFQPILSRLQIKEGKGNSPVGIFFIFLAGLLPCVEYQFLLREKCLGMIAMPQASRGCLMLTRGCKTEYSAVVKAYYLSFFSPFLTFLYSAVEMAILSFFKLFISINSWKI
jgi:hypothetical protein